MCKTRAPSSNGESPPGRSKWGTDYPTQITSRLPLSNGDAGRWPLREGAIRNILAGFFRFGADRRASRLPDQMGNTRQARDAWVTKLIYEVTAKTRRIFVWKAAGIQDIIIQPTPMLPLADQSDIRLVETAEAEMV
ncbi:hypothetical protein C8R44DRAFT_753798 [Mycena epipterygia]|nr:hypothetical protein C8R44DRAFT_753798 [Mycena epipterygia]